jgi:hypothetical protein
MRGNVLLWRQSDAKVVGIAKETKVGPADRLGTKEGEPATFSTEGGTVVALKGVRSAADRGLGIELRDSKLFFRFFEGKIAVQTFEQGVKIETQQGLITATNSYLMVEVEKEGGVKLHAVSGEPTFTNSLGSVTVEAGKETVVEPGKKPSAPKAADVGKAVEEFTRHETAYNLVKNPGFEDGLKDWDAAMVFSGGGKRQTELDSTLPHSGRACVRADFGNKIQSKENPFRFMAQAIPVTVGKTYLMRVYYRGEIREGQMNTRIALYNVEGPETWRFTPEKTWRMLTARVVAKEKVLNLIIEALPESDRYDGSFWVDDFFIAELPAPAKK